MGISIENELQSRSYKQAHELIFSSKVQTTTVFPLISAGGDY